MLPVIVRELVIEQVIDIIFVKLFGSVSESRMRFQSAPGLCRALPDVRCRLERYCDARCSASRCCRSSVAKEHKAPLHVIELGTAAHCSFDRYRDASMWSACVSR